MILRQICILIFPVFAKGWIVQDSDYASMPPIFHIDDYDNCMLYGTKALFCGMGFRVSPKNPQNTSRVWQTIQTLSKSKKYYNHDLLRHGICVTKMCPKITETHNLNVNSVQFIKELEECYNPNFEDFDLKGKIEYIRCQTSQSLYSMNFLGYIFCTFIAIFVTLVLFAWIYDLFCKPDLKGPKFVDTLFGKYVSSFSLAQNWNRLVHINLENPDEKALSNIQGVRFFNLVGVIICHSATFNVALPIQNPRYIETVIDRKFEQFIGMGGRHTTLQTFFLMSAFLHAYKFFTDCEGKNKVTLSYMVRCFFSRYFRLTPMVALVTIFVATVMPHLADGPLWDYVVGDEYRTCKDRWWYNIIYLNNMLPLHEMCLPHLWSLSVDLQYYALGLLIMYFIWNYESKAIFILASVWFYHMYQTFFSYYKKVYFSPLNPEMSYNTTLVNLGEFIILYKASTTNVAGFIWGLAFGYLFYKCRQKKIFTKKIYVTLWWLICWGSMMLIVTFPGFFLHFGDDNELIFAIYMAVSRSIFSFGNGLFIFGMTQGQGHILRSICEWPVIYILGRLNFSAYLIHVCIQRFIAGLKRSPNFVNDYLIVFDSLSYFAVSYMAAILLALFFEYPFTEIKKHVTDAMKKKKIMDFDSDKKNT